MMMAVDDSNMFEERPGRHFFPTSSAPSPTDNNMMMTMMMDDEPGSSRNNRPWSWRQHANHKRARTVDEDGEEGDYDCITPVHKRRRIATAHDSEAEAVRDTFWPHQQSATITPSPATSLSSLRLGGAWATGIGRSRLASASDEQQECEFELDVVQPQQRQSRLSHLFQAMASAATAEPEDHDESEDGAAYEKPETYYMGQSTSSSFCRSAEPPTFFPVRRSRLRRPLRWGRILLCALSCFLCARAMWMTQAAAVDHIIPPLKGGTVSDVTLRDFITDEAGFSLGMAPAFFGFYGYFGSLAAWEEAVAADILHPQKGQLKQVAGASAGAMAAILLAAGVSPLKAAEFCAQVSLKDFADFPGVLAFFRGQRFEKIMEDYLDRESNCHSLLLEDSLLPVAVSAFDLESMAGQILTKGSMARAARASATFPFLFQPVGWKDHHDDATDYTLIDGGIADPAGVAGLVGRNPGRVVNLKISPFWGQPPPPSEIPGSTHVVSISIQNLPQPGPWAMELGPVAVEAASKAMKASLDIPLYKGKEENHYELHIDASSFWK